MTNKVEKKKGNLLIFLEILSCEGGIQSYVKDIFQAYKYLTTIGVNSAGGETDILLLRDGPESKNPYKSESLYFYYLKTQPAWLGRFKLAATLLWCLVTKQPQQVFAVILI